MKQSTIVTAIVFVCLGIIGYWAGSYVASHTTSESDDAINHDAHTIETNDSNAAHHQLSNVTDDKSFLEAMVPHHNEAVRSGLVVLERGATTDEVRNLVTAIVTAQEAEINAMQLWYEEWYGTPLQPANHQPMMRDLAALDGVALDRAFFEDMIAHHDGAIEMAESIIGITSRSEIRTLAETIIATQQAEKETMSNLLANLPAGE